LLVANALDTMPGELEDASAILGGPEPWDHGAAHKPSPTSRLPGAGGRAPWSRFSARPDGRCFGSPAISPRLPAGFPTP